jgi:hypothetical protein
MAQPQRGLIPLLLDAQAVEEWTGGLRLYECPYITVAGAGLDTTATEGSTTTGSLTIANVALEPDEPLNWTITEAADDCSSPSDLDWVSASASAGTTATGASADLEVTFDATAHSAPDAFSGLLCIASNDPGEPLIVIPVSFQVEYPFGGLLSPIGDGVNVVTAGSNVPVKFRVGGQRTSAVLAAGFPVSVELDCSTLEPIGGPVATNSGSGLVWSTDKYQYDWKTAKSWNDTCRELVVALDDGTVHTAIFQFVS